MIEKARNFMYHNARPLDLARWKYHFENGSKDAVLSILETYQNGDGGFGYGLEADCFNPNSSPIQTWAATQILREIGLTDSRNSIVQGILRYLESGADFDAAHNQWLNTIPSNNNYPHAIWWEYSENGSDFKYNPTAALAGFAIKYAEQGSELHKKSCEITKQAVNWFLTEAPNEGHVTGCFIRLYEYCTEAGVELFDTALLLKKLKEQVYLNICRDTKRWRNEYVTTPSNLITSKATPFYEDNTDIISAECRFIKENQLPDGSFNVPWQWWTEYKEYEIAVNWWKGDFIIRNINFLKEFD